MSDFKNGEMVFARWSGSRKFLRGKILKVSTEKVQVEFEDGTKDTVQHGDLQKIKSKSSRNLRVSSPVMKRYQESPPSPAKAEIATKARSKSRSESRGRQRSTSKSPARTKSSSKSPSRLKGTKNPVGRPKSPKSPSKPKTRESKSPRRSPGRPKSPARPKSPGLAKPVKPVGRPKSPTKSIQTSKSSSSGSSVGGDLPKQRGRPKTKNLVSSSSDSRSPSPVIVKKSDKNKKVQSISFEKEKRVEEFTVIGGRSSRQSTRSSTGIQEITQSKNNPEVSLKDIFASKLNLGNNSGTVFEQKEPKEREKVYVTRLRSALPSKEDEVDAKEPEIIVLPQKKSQVSFLSSLQSLLGLFLMPILTGFLILACVRNNGTLLAVPKIPKIVRAYLSPIPLGIYFAFVALQAILMYLPVGKVVEGFKEVSKTSPRYLPYRINGLAALFLTVSLLPVGVYYEIPSDYITLHFLHFACASVLFTLVLSIGLYIKSFYVKPNKINEYGDSRWIYHNIMIGRELNPRLGKMFDFKMFIFRVGMIGWVVIDLLLLYKCYLTHGCVHYTLAASAIMQILFIVDVFWREEAFLATAAVMHEGLGLAMMISICTMGSFTQPLSLLYLLNNKYELPNYCLAGIAALYLFGHFLSRRASYEKFIIKRNPRHPSAKSLKTIPYGRRNLVVSGCWGLVRHPNYLGDLIVQLAWSLPCGFVVGVPYAPVALAALMVFFRIFLVEKHMERSYGVAWQDYKNRVPKRLIPFIF